jgi:hypothetical protein
MILATNNKGKLEEIMDLDLMKYSNYQMEWH